MLKAVTLTGVDERTSYEWVEDMAGRYPIAEFGILLSVTADGTDNRYPKIDLIERFAERCQSGLVNTALHVCGRAVKRFVDGDDEIRGLAARFGRVQLNFNAGRVAFTIDDLDHSIRSFSRPVITQHNSANASVTEALSAPNHHVLFDASGGRGLHSTSWPERLAGKFYGYAGGFGPTTLLNDLDGASASAAGRQFWIDMESRLRWDDWLDLDICETVLRDAKTWSEAERYHAKAADFVFEHDPASKFD